MTGRNEIRPAGVAGILYPGDRLTLERRLSLLLESAPLLSFPSPIRGMIVPHDAYEDAGGVAARAYRQIIQEKYDLIVVVAASHEDSYDFASIYPGRAFQTPLGEVVLHRESIEVLTHLHEPVIQRSARGYAAGEYALEVQLPFIKWMQQEARVLPLVMGNQSPALIGKLYAALASVLAKQHFLIIGSSDLSRSYPEADARALDHVAVDNIKRFSPERLQEDIRDQRCEMSGYGPAIVAMKTAKSVGAYHARVLLYRTSADVTGRRAQVAGYVAGVFY